MPQIRKIRIANLYFNHGTRHIPDMLIDLTSHVTDEAYTTLLNLLNGGGKTVMVQMIMQPVHPRAKAAGRDIESYFERASDHAYIVLEWEIENSRKRLLTGISISASANNTDDRDDDKRGNTIKYYTFSTQYEANSPYSIVALDLSKNENGKYVPATYEYVRERAKQSKDVLRYFADDDDAEWVRYLASYGILRSEWETVIEAVNQSEGGLDVFFAGRKNESGTCDTSDKLIKNFFIPAIEHKLKSAASKNSDSSLETMLVNYAKKIADKDTVIREKEYNERLLVSLKRLGDEVRELWNANDQYSEKIAEIYGFGAALNRSIDETDAEIKRIGQELRDSDELLEHIEYEEKSKAYYIAQESFESVKIRYDEIKQAVSDCRERKEKVEHLENLLECAKLYDEIKGLTSEIDELKKSIENDENDSEAAARIASLKYSVRRKAEKELEELKAVLEESISALNKAEHRLDECKKAEDAAKEAWSSAELDCRARENAYKGTQSDNDRLMVRLGLELTRNPFTSFYDSAEIDRAGKCKRDEKEKYEKEIAEKKSYIKQVEDKLHKLPNERAGHLVKLEANNLKIEILKKEISDYELIFTKIRELCEKYDYAESVFTNGLAEKIHDFISVNAEKISMEEKKCSTLRAKKEAAEGGYLHILPEVMRYVRTTGIKFITGEEYLCGLISDGNMTKEDVGSLLDKYPEFAYSLLFDTAKDLNEIKSAGNREWFPVSVPLFTMQQVDGMFSGVKDAADFLTFCDLSYFEDNRKYIDKLTLEIDRIEGVLKGLNVTLAEAREDEKAVDKFDYDEGWKSQRESELLSVEEDSKNLRMLIEALDIKEEELNTVRESTKDELETVENELNNLETWLEIFADFSIKTSREIELFNEHQDAVAKSRSAENSYKKAAKETRESGEEADALSKKRDEYDRIVGETNELLIKVDNAAEAPVIEGDLRELYQRYIKSQENLGREIEGKQFDLNVKQERLSDAQQSLYSYKCDETEYRDIRYTSAAKRDIKNRREILGEELNSLEHEKDQLADEHARKSERFERAREDLNEYDGTPLPKDEIRDRFGQRKKEVSVKKRNLNNEKEASEKRRNFLNGILGRVKDSDFVYNNQKEPKSIVLSERPDEQWKTICGEAKGIRDRGDKLRAELSKDFSEVRFEFTNRVLTEITDKIDELATMAESSDIRGDALYTVYSGIEEMNDSIIKINGKIEDDLKNIDSDFQVIATQCFMQGQRIYNDLCKIIESSRVKIYEDKPQIQMIRTDDLPKEIELNEEASMIAIKEAIRNGATTLKDMIKSGEVDEPKLRKRAKAVVGSDNLFHKYIRRESVSLSVYKIDVNENNSHYEKWENAIQNKSSSGGERFVICFAVIMPMINYSRALSNVDIKKMKSVLVLDNPFGVITSGHLLKPLFRIADHFSCQLLCFSDISASDVVSCFRSVVKLRIKQQLFGNNTVLTHDENEKIEHGYYKMTSQLSFLD
ncbi:MAG: hypothetical protein K6A45_02880 [Lachnospiraceae bacterium]|nr:hypothetical protein [Lachnospiraceae bacterium]